MRLAGSLGWTPTDAVTLCSPLRQGLEERVCTYLEQALLQNQLVHPEDACSPEHAGAELLELAANMLANPILASCESETGNSEFLRHQMRLVLEKIA